MIGRCSHCKREFVPAEIVFQEIVHGYVKIRGAGGANAIRGKKASGKYFCLGCVNEFAKGTENQEVLF